MTPDNDTTGTGTGTIENSNAIAAEATPTGTVLDMGNKLRAQILGANDIESELVHVKQWDANVEVRSMTALERADMLQEAMGEDGKMDFTNLYPSIIVATCFDPDTGERIFKRADADALNSKSAAAIEKLATVAMKLSGLNEAGTDAVGKDLSATPNGTSTTDSPKSST